MLRSAEALRAVDDLSRSVVEVADSRGPTIFLYLSDNGFSFGSHRWKTKGCGYEACGRVPGLIRSPGNPQGLLASIADLAPTLADFAGVADSATDGRSLMPEMLGESVQPADRAILLHFRHTSENGIQPTYWGVRTRRWKYLRYGRMAGSPRTELFDLQADPDELTNLAERPAFRPVIDELQEDLASLRSAAPVP